MDNRKIVPELNRRAKEHDDRFSSLSGSNELLFSVSYFPARCLSISREGKKSINISSPITSLQIDGETIEAVRDFIFLGSNITVDGDCSLEIKRRLLLEQKAMTNLAA